MSWKGDLENGTGTIEQVGSGAFGPLAVSWAARTGDESGMTSPEELIAAAHASCFSMAFSNGLSNAGTPPDRLEVLGHGHVRPRHGDHGVGARGDGMVPGISEEAFVAAAEVAKENCPVSGALKGNVELSVTARLAA